MGERVGFRAARRGSASVSLLLLAALFAPQGAASAPVQPRTCFGEVVTIKGSRGPDRIVGTDGADVILGRAGDDVILGADGADRICGGGGDDRIDGRYGDDFVDAEDGNDTVRGGPGSDYLIGDDGRDELRGGSGRSDTLVGGEGNDRLVGGDGDSDSDHLFGGDGNDALDGGLGGRDELYGGAGNDHLLRGLVSYEFSEGPVVASMPSTPSGTSEASGEGDDRIFEPDGIVGSDHSDVLTGGDGGDLLRGRAGDDLIYAGAGDDRVDGGPGSDDLDGGEGADLLGFGDSSAGVEAILGDGTAQGAGTDVHRGFEDLAGSHFDDRLTGDEGPNNLDGSFGSNAIFGLGGDDNVHSASSGDAGEGTDTCSAAQVASCEIFVESLWVPTPFLSEPVQGEDVERLRAVSGGTADRERRAVDVGIRRMTGQGCSWWDVERNVWVRDVCGLVHANAVRARRGEWSLGVNTFPPPGNYLVVVQWGSASPAVSCEAVFRPVCVSFDVRR
ncbi:MAG TPA: calcium-binding protein [Actinomycetota bacterium]|nr:calcium-binding protein [Actinomycetota bacterium]